MIIIILTKELKVGINYKNIEHFKRLGYDVKCGQKITIPVEHLSEYSNLKIIVECDVCKTQKEIKYQSYVNGTKHQTLPYCCCTKCAWEVKNRKTNLEKYGEESWSSTKQGKEKYKETCLNKYGVDNYSQTDEFNQKYKETMNEKYGVDNGFQLEEIKNKSRQTMIKKFGVEYNMQREDMKKLYLNGDKNYFYIDGTHEPNEWNTPLAKRIKVQVFIRDNRTCDCCNKHKQNLNAHHLYSRDNNKDLMYDLDNLITLCVECHKEFHKKYGYGNNTKEQYIEFKQNKLECVESIES